MEFIESIEWQYIGLAVVSIVKVPKVHRIKRVTDDLIGALSRRRRRRQLRVFFLLNHCIQPILCETCV